MSVHIVIDIFQVVIVLVNIRGYVEMLTKGKGLSMKIEKLCIWTIKELSIYYDAILANGGWM